MTVLLRLLLLILLIAAPSGAPTQPHTAAAADGPSALRGASHDPAPVPAALHGDVREVGVPLPAIPSGASHEPVTPNVFASSRERPAEPGDDGLGVRSDGSASMPAFSGVLSWVSPSYGDRYLALPQPRGTLALVCGPSACVTRVSTDYGPDQRVNPDRIADLSARDWSSVCGISLSVGLCPGSVTLVGLPATDQ